MKKIEFAISIGSNLTHIYKAGVGVVLSDRSVVVTGVKGRKEKHSDYNFAPLTPVLLPLLPWVPTSEQGQNGAQKDI